MQLTQLVSLFLSDVCAGLTNATPSTYQTKLRFLIAFLGDIATEDLTFQDLERFRIYMLTRPNHYRGKRLVSGPLSRFTIRTVCVTVRHFLRWSSDRGYISHDLVKKFILPSCPKPEPKAISQKAIDQLIAYAAAAEGWESSRNIAIIYLLRDTGGRVGGLVHADLDDLDLETATLLVREKGGQLRYLYLTSATIRVLRTWLDDRSRLNPTHYKLFINRSMSPLTAQNIRRMLNHLASIAGIQGRVNPHSFRHAYARDMLRAGADLSQVSQLMGHSSIVVTADYYARWADRELKQLHNKYSPGRLLP